MILIHILSREPYTQHYRLQPVLKGQKQNYKEGEIEKSSVRTHLCSKGKNQIRRPRYSDFNGNCNNCHPNSKKYLQSPSDISGGEILYQQEKEVNTTL